MEPEVCAPPVTANNYHQLGELSRTTSTLRSGRIGCSRRQAIVGLSSVTCTPSNIDCTVTASGRGGPHQPSPSPISLHGDEGPLHMVLCHETSTGVRAPTPTSYSLADRKPETLA